MQEFDHLIVGGGLAAASAVDGIRERDEHGTILLLTEEGEPPYHRPPLSKDYLRNAEAGRDLLHVKPENWFDEEAAVELLTEVRVTTLDPRERVVTTDGGERFRGERLLLATGGRPRTLAIPGIDLAGVHTLRTVEDSEALREAASRVDRALLIGSGFIGMELAASFTGYGIEPVVVETRDRVWPSMLPPRLSEFVRGHFEARGVEFRLASDVEELRGDGRVRSALLAGGEEIACELVVVGVGIDPNDGLAVEAGLAAADGIVVDKYGETSHGYIYAAGDVARFPDPFFGDVTRVEHWDHARAHGKLVGRNMAGGKESYDHLSYFFSDVFDLSFNVFGRPAGADRVIVRGELGAGRSLAFCGVEGRLAAAVLINANDAMDFCRDLVRRRPTMQEVEDELENPDLTPGELVDA